MAADIYSMGLDVGSTTSKCLILKNGAEILGSAIIPAGTGTTGPGRAIAAALESSGVQREAISVVTATGYGRNSFAGADYVISELSAHAIGAHAMFPEAATVIDIGGQDAKAIRISADGKLDQFMMNDKCAAGTGRFLDVMARVLEMDVNELAEADARAEKIVNISSTCTVFAESEVISQLANDTDKCDIINGIHMSVAGRVAGLAHRVGVQDLVVMTGGVAQNSGVVKALEDQLGHKVHTSPLTQYVGALGAALFAYKRYNK